jgi:HAMP domain-containing protein
VNRRWRPRGLHAKFAILAGATLLVMVAMVLLLLQRQGAMQSDVVRQSRSAMHALLFERLRAHGQAQAAQVADSLVNPLYYFDLDAIGVIARDVLRQPDVGYVLVYDDNGDILHDGSGDIPTYGQAMRDPLAYEAVSSPGIHAQWTDRVLEVSAPIKVGDQQLGGVRIGYSLDGVRADETRASGALGERLGAIGARHLWLIGIALLGLVALAAAASFALQRVLVRPIRDLADAAREIEAGNFEATVAPSPRNDELGDLMRA